MVEIAGVDIMERKCTLENDGKVKKGIVIEIIERWNDQLEVVYTSNMLLRIIIKKLISYCNSYRVYGRVTRETSMGPFCKNHRKLIGNINHTHTKYRFKKILKVNYCFKIPCKLDRWRSWFRSRHRRRHKDSPSPHRPVSITRHIHQSIRHCMHNTITYLQLNLVTLLCVSRSHFHVCSSCDVHVHASCPGSNPGIQTSCIVPHVIPDMSAVLQL